MKALKTWLYFNLLCILGKVSLEILQNAINAGKEAGEKKEPVVKQRLQYVDSVTTDPQQNLNFLEFFQDREGLSVWDSFAKNILKYVTGLVDKVQPITAYYFDLKTGMSDSEINQELPKDCEFGLIEGLALILWLLLKQWGGRDGALLNAGYRANIFYLKVFNNVVVVNVSWYVDDGLWNVRAWKFVEDGQWRVDRRVFSRTMV